MPGGIFLGGMCNFNDQGTNAAGSNGTTITASATANTKGAYAQLVASTPYDASGFYLNLGNASNGAAGFLIDIAIGSSGSEVGIVFNVLYCFTTNQFFQSGPIFIPYAIPAGSRVAARCQSAVASATITASVVLGDGVANDRPPSCNTNTFGVSTAGSIGSVVDPGATANTKGAWTQLVSSTPYDISSFQPMFDNQRGAAQSAQWLVDFGVGASGSEIVIVPDLILSCHNASSILYGALPPLVNKLIPAGSRFAVRAQSNNVTAGTRKFGCGIIGYSQ